MDGREWAIALKYGPIAPIPSRACRRLGPARRRVYKGRARGPGSNRGMEGVTVHRASALLDCCVHGTPKGPAPCEKCAQLVLGSRPVAKKGLRLQRVCPHGRVKNDCRLCEGSGFCPHHVQRKTCWVCRGTQVCKHIKNKAYCAECGGRLLCQVCRKTIVRLHKVCRRCREAAPAEGDGGQG